MMNLQRIRPLVHKDLTKTKLSHNDPIGFALFESQTATKARETSAIIYMDPHRPPSRYRFFKTHHQYLTERQATRYEYDMGHQAVHVDHAAAAQLAEAQEAQEAQHQQALAAWQVQAAAIQAAQLEEGEMAQQLPPQPLPPPPLVIPPVQGGDAVPAPLSPNFYRNLTATAAQLHKEEKAMEKEQAAFALIYAYIKSVAGSAHLTTIDSIISSKTPGTDETIPPFQAYTQIMTYLRQSCCSKPAQVRRMILVEREGTGMADCKLELLTLLDHMDHYRTILRDFDAAHPTEEHPLTVASEILLVLSRMVPNAVELQFIKEEMNRQIETPGFTTEQFVTATRAACQSHTLSLTELHQRELERGRKEGETALSQANSMAMAASGSSSQPVYRTDMRAYRAEGTHTQQQYDEQMQAQIQAQCYRAESWGGQQAYRGEGWQGSVQQALLSAPVPHPGTAFVKQGGYTPVANRPAAQAMAAWNSDTPVPVPTMMHQPAFPGYSDVVRQSGICRNYPYCNFEVRREGCIYKHQHRDDHTEEEDAAIQAWHNNERLNHRQGGPPEAPAGPQKGPGNTPGAADKRQRFA